MEREVENEYRQQLDYVQRRKLFIDDAAKEHEDINKEWLILLDMESSLIRMIKLMNGSS